MSIVSQGVGSGLDIAGIVSKLMSVEQQPMIKLQSDGVALKSEVSAYGSLKSAVSTFHDAVDGLADLSKFKVYAATSSDATVVNTSASSTAARGIYNVTVDRIAENHRMASGSTFANTDTATIGATGDTMTVGVGGKQFVVAIGGQTLSQVRDAINNATDNTGVTASILKDDTGYRLSLSANNTGSANALTTSYSAADPFALTTLNADRDKSGSFTAADLDASVHLEGQFSITSSSNSLTDTIQGVTLTLKQAGTVTVNVDRDTAAVQASVQSFANAYSALTGIMTKMSGDVLQSDNSMLGGMQSQMRGILNAASQASGTFANVFQIGLSTQKDGSLQVDTSVLNNALQTDFDGVANLFADPNNGLAGKLRDLANNFLNTGGAIDSRVNGLNSEIRDNAQQQSDFSVRLTTIQARYNKQFNALDSLVAQLNQTGTFITQQLALLNTNTTNNRTTSSG